MDITTEKAKQLKIKQISLSRSGQNILQEVTLSLPSNGVTVLLGANGAGKSSLLKVLAGISLPDSGQTQQDFKGLAYLMPEPAVFYPHLTVTEQLQFVADQCGCWDHSELVSGALKTWQLEEQANKLTCHLSLGYRQRLSLAQLTVSGADILLLDEPMNGMDPEILAAFKAHMLNWKQDRTVVMATHIMHEAQAMADWVVVMHQGRVLHSGAYQQDTDFHDLYQNTLQAHHQQATTSAN